MRLSAVVITKNESDVIRDCLQSLRFCDETIVVDSGSSDDTVEIARSMGARVIERGWPGYGPQKEFARQQAKGDWVLSLDADERVSTALRTEIEALLATPKLAFDALEMPRLSTFCGRPMRYSGWWPDRIVRLFRRDAAFFSDDIVHERVVASGMIGRLDNHIEHHPIREISHALRRMDVYSSLGAEKLLVKGKRPGLLTAWTHASYAFVSTYVLKRGFLDGQEGLLNAFIHAQTVFWKYAKASVELRRRRARAD